jgi:hypothetical protein
LVFSVVPSLAIIAKQSPCQVFGLFFPMVYAGKCIAHSMPRAKSAGLLGKKCQVQAIIAYQKRGILYKPRKANDLRGITANSVPRLERGRGKGDRYIAI